MGSAASRMQSTLARFETLCQAKTPATELWLCQPSRASRQLASSSEQTSQQHLDFTDSKTFSTIRLIHLLNILLVATVIYRPTKIFCPRLDPSKHLHPPDSARPFLQSRKTPSSAVAVDMLITPTRHHDRETDAARRL